MRTIVVNSTKGATNLKIETEVNTVGELFTLLEPHGIPTSFDTNQFLTFPSRVSLGSLNQDLPEGNFALHITPIKQKAGIDRKGIFEYISKLPKEEKVFFIVNGQNHTRLKTDVLIDLYNKHTSKGKTKPAPSKKEEVKKESAKKVVKIVKSVPSKKEDVKEVVKIVKSVPMVDLTKDGVDRNTEVSLQTLDERLTNVENMLEVSGIKAKANSKISKISESERRQFESSLKK